MSNYLSYFIFIVIGEYLVEISLLINKIVDLSIFIIA